MSQPTELLIARHGEAHCNVNRIIGGPIGCTGLTERGRHQVQQLARRLQAEHAQRPITAIYTTPLRRTAQSAGLIADALGVEVTSEPDLAEADYGSVDGRAWTEVVRAFGGIPVHEPYRPLAPGAEPWAAYLERACAALDRLLQRHQGQRMLILGHGETVVAAAHHFLGLPASATASAGFAAYPASLTRWAEQPASWVRPELGWRWTLIQLNDTSHEMLRDCGGDQTPRVLGAP